MLVDVIFFLKNASTEILFDAAKKVVKLWNYWFQFA